MVVRVPATSPYRFGFLPHCPHKHKDKPNGVVGRGGVTGGRAWKDTKGKAPKCVPGSRGLRVCLLHAFQRDFLNSHLDIIFRGTEKVQV